MKRTNIYLGDAQTALLDRIAADEGISRAELIRRLLDRALRDEDQDREVALAAIDASFGSLADVDLPDRGTDARERHLDQVWRTAP